MRNPLFCTVVEQTLCTINLESLPEHAPQDVKDACKRVLAHIKARIKPPLDLIQFVQSWLGKNQAQNRWGN